MIEKDRQPVSMPPKIQVISGVIALLTFLLLGASLLYFGLWRSAGIPTCGAECDWGKTANRPVIDGAFIVAVLLVAYLITGIGQYRYDREPDKAIEIFRLVLAIVALTVVLGTSIWTATNWYDWYDKYQRSVEYLS